MSIPIDVGGGEARRGFLTPIEIAEQADGVRLVHVAIPIDVAEHEPVGFVEVLGQRIDILGCLSHTSTETERK